MNRRYLMIAFAFLTSTLIGLSAQAAPPPSYAPLHKAFVNARQQVCGNYVLGTAAYLVEQGNFKADSTQETAFVESGFNACNTADPWQALSATIRFKTWFLAMANTYEKTEKDRLNVIATALGNEKSAAETVCWTAARTVHQIDSGLTLESVQERCILDPVNGIFLYATQAGLIDQLRRQETPKPRASLPLRELTTR
ncbi:MAG: hypothetical protein PHW63_00270 [Alphaproteobacteria bacterium]|nr:hypothetical protein [Alphaproteobacteria bacterium]